MRLLLLGILALGLILRVTGLGFGLPLELRPDESWYRVAVTRMIETGNPDPELFSYPGLPFHALLAVSWAAHSCARALGFDVAPELADFVADVTVSTWIQRLLSCLAGTVTLLAVFRLGRHMGSPVAGLIAALFLSVSHLHVRESHFGTVDSTTCLLVVLSLLAVARAISRGRHRDFLLAGFVAGVATATRYTPALLALPLAVAATTACGRRDGTTAGKAWLTRVTLAGLAMLLTFLACAPYTLLSWDRFLAGFGEQAAASTGSGRRLAFTALDKHLTLSLGSGMGWPMVIVGTAGLLLVALRPRRLRAAVALYGVAHLALITTSAIDFIRYALPLAPIVALFAAIAIDTPLRRLPSRRRLAASLLLAFVVAAPSLYRSVRHDLLLLRTSTFEQTQEWIEAHCPPDHRLVFTSPTLQRVIGCDDRRTPFDPQAILFGDEPTWIVAARHPHRNIENIEGLDALLQAGAGEVVARFPAFETGAASEARFDDKDSFFYPFDGLGGACRGGPEVTIHRIAPQARPGELPPPPPSVHEVLAGYWRDQLVVAWKAKPSDAVVAWAVRFASLAELEAKRIPEPSFVPAGLRRHVFHEIGPGAYWVSVSPVGVGGEGPMQSFGPVTLPDPGR